MGFLETIKTLKSLPQEVDSLRVERARAILKADREEQKNAKLQHKFERTVKALQGYHAARQTRLNADTWSTRTPIDPNADLRGGGRVLRARARDLWRNHPIFRALIKARMRAVIPTPLGIEPAVRSPLGKETADTQRFNREASALFRKWAMDADAFSIDGKTNLIAAQRQVVWCHLISGEVFTVKHRRKQAGLPSLRIELVEPDYLAALTPAAKQTWNTYGRHGVEYDEDGRPVRYWFSKPEDVYQPIEVTAERVIHTLLTEFPGQDIGEPISAYVGELMHHYGRYLLAEVQGQEITAQWAGVRKILDESGFGEQTGTAEDYDGDTVNRGETDLWSGQILDLLPGEDFTQLRQDRPGNGFDPFVNHTVHTAGAAAGVMPELWYDMSNANFSVSRMASLVNEDDARPVREMLRDGWLCRVYRWFIQESVRAGLLRPVMGLELEDHYACTVKMPGRRYVDPQKEVSADLEAIKGGLTTFSDVLARNGSDIDDIIEKRREDSRKFAEAGLPDPYESLQQLELALPAEDVPQDPEDMATALGKRLLTFNGNGNGVH